MFDENHLGERLAIAPPKPIHRWANADDVGFSWSPFEPTNITLKDVDMPYNYQLKKPLKKFYVVGIGQS